MQQTLEQPTTRTLNRLGTAYHKAKESRKLQFKAALAAFSERDSKDYWRAFRTVWQYSTQTGSIPFAIVSSAFHALDFTIDNLTEQ